MEEWSERLKETVNEECLSRVWTERFCVCACVWRERERERGREGGRERERERRTLRKEEIPKNRGGKCKGGDRWAFEYVEERKHRKRGVWGERQVDIRKDREKG